jgi:hypothetical protein
VLSPILCVARDRTAHQESIRKGREGADSCSGPSFLSNPTAVSDHRLRKVAFLSDNPEFLTIHQACRIVGGDEKPISVATYYRGVKAGRLPAPEHPTPGISRIRRRSLIAMLNASDNGGA